MSKDFALLITMYTQGGTLAISYGRITEASCCAKWSLRFEYEVDPSVVILTTLSIDAVASWSIVFAFKSGMTIISKD